MKLKLGDKVKTIENHKCLEITKRMTAVVTKITKHMIGAKFKVYNGTTWFCPEDLRRVK